MGAQSHTKPTLGPTRIRITSHSNFKGSAPPIQTPIQPASRLGTKRKRTVGGQAQDDEDNEGLDGDEQQQTGQEEEEEEEEDAEDNDEDDQDDNEGDEDSHGGKSIGPVKSKTVQNGLNSSTKKITLRLRPPPPPPFQAPQTVASPSKTVPVPYSTTPKPLPLTPAQLLQLKSHGLTLWNKIVNSKDSDGRSRTEPFMDLPSAFDYPDYYHVIRKPIALNSIRQKLESDTDPYQTYDKLYSDIRKVFNNAKKYNLEKSLIYEDAHQLIKLLKHEIAFIANSTNPVVTQDHSVTQREPSHKKLKIKLRPSVPANSTVSTPDPPAGISVARSEPEAPQPTIVPTAAPSPAPAPAPLPAPVPAPGPAVVLAAQPASVLEPKKVVPVEAPVPIVSKAPKAASIPTPTTPSSEPVSALPPPSTTVSNHIPPSTSTSSSDNTSQLPLPTVGTAPSTPRLRSRSPPKPTQRPVTPPIPPAPLPPPMSPSKKESILINLRNWIKTIIKSLEEASDPKTGRRLIEEFLTLPDKTRWKTYYQVIPNPMALENIKSRNDRRGYNDFERFKEDVLLIFKNAQHFNEDGSIVWKDSKTLEAKFLSLIQDPPEEIKSLVCKSSIPNSPNKKTMNGDSQPTTTLPNSRSEVQKVLPPPAVIEPENPESGTTTPRRGSPMPIEGLRRSPRSPSRPPSNEPAGTPPRTLLPRALSPLPHRASSPLASQPVLVPSIPTIPRINPIGNGIHTRSNLVPSRLGHDISPALLSLNAQQNITHDLTNNRPTPIEAIAQPRGMSVIPTRVMDKKTGYLAMIKRFKINTSNPKTIETLKLSNRKCLQHGFEVPKNTQQMKIEVEMNKDWMNLVQRTLRSKNNHHSEDKRREEKMIMIEQVKIRGHDYVEMIKKTKSGVNKQQQEQEEEEDEAEDEGEDEEVGEEQVWNLELIDGINLVEFNVIGRKSNQVDFEQYSSLNSTGPSSSSLTNSSQFVKEVYRLFIYR